MRPVPRPLAYAACALALAATAAWALPLPGRAQDVAHHLVLGAGALLPALALRCAACRRSRRPAVCP